MDLPDGSETGLGADPATQGVHFWELSACDGVMNAAGPGTGDSGGLAAELRSAVYRACVLKELKSIRQLLFQRIDRHSHGDQPQP